MQFEMRAIVVAVGDLLPEQPPQMVLVPHDDVMEKLPPNAPDPALRLLQAVACTCRLQPAAATLPRRGAPRA